jgi:hypothetical protein
VPFCAEFFNAATLDDFLVLLAAVPDVFDLNFAFSQELSTSDELLQKAGFDTGELGVQVRARCALLRAPAAAGRLACRGSSLTEVLQCGQLVLPGGREEAATACVCRTCPPPQVPLAGTFSLSGPQVDRALVTPEQLQLRAAAAAAAANSTSSPGNSTAPPRPASPAGSGAPGTQELISQAAELGRSFGQRANATLEALLRSRAPGNGTLAGGGEAALEAADGPEEGPLPEGGGAGAAQPQPQPQPQPQVALPVRQGTGSSLDAVVPRIGQAQEQLGPGAQGAASSQFGDQLRADAQSQQNQQQQQGGLSGLLSTIANSPVAKFLSREAQRLPSARLASGTSDILRNLTSSSVAQVANRTAEVSGRALQAGRQGRQGPSASALH